MPCFSYTARVFFCTLSASECLVCLFSVNGVAIFVEFDDMSTYRLGNPVGTFPALNIYNNVRSSIFLSEKTGLFALNRAHMTNFTLFPCLYNINYILFPGGFSWMLWCVRFGCGFGLGWNKTLNNHMYLTISMILLSSAEMSVWTPLWKRCYIYFLLFLEFQEHCRTRIRHH